MSFLDDFGKKITNVSQEALSKTKDLTDTAKLKAGIFEEEGKIKTAYAEIGKKYVELHLEDYETCFESDISSIVTARNKIAEYESKIAEIKATKEQ